MKYKRILLKLSGESLTGDDGYGVSYDHIMHYATEIKSAVDAGVQVAVVIGGGNIFRGVQGASAGFERRQGDQMGDGGKTRATIESKHSNTRHGIRDAEGGKT